MRISLLYDISNYLKKGIDEQQTKIRTNLDWQRPAA